MSNFDKCPNDFKFFEEQYKILKKSTYKIAKEFNLCPSVVYKKVRFFGLNRKHRDSIPKGENNPKWKGDKVSYDALHDWINRNKPRPLFCEICKAKRSQDCANISGEYKRDINDFEWLCRKCHREFDKPRLLKMFLIKKVKNGLIICSRCNQLKLPNNFYKRKKSPTGYRGECKSCSKRINKFIQLNKEQKEKISIALTGKVKKSMSDCGIKLNKEQKEKK